MTASATVMTPEQLGAFAKRLPPLRLTKYIPHAPTARQAAGLLLPQREVLYGGAAGGGKSDWLLMAALQYVDQPGYAAILLRRTFAQLAKAESLIPRAHEWLSSTDAHWDGTRSRWTFPSGALLEFGHLQYEVDKYNYQSAAYQFVGFDELTQFTESQYRYLFSRLRRLKGVGVPLRMWSASNPGGEGHEWVKRRMVKERNGSRVFLPAKLADNPYLDAEEYRESLANLDPVTRAQLLNGDWVARQEGGLFRREWFEIVEAAPTDLKRVRAWDLAATKAKPGVDPDYTCGCKMGSKDGTFWIEDMRRTRVTPAGVDNLLLQTAKLDGREVEIWIEQEPGSSGKIAIAHFVKLLAGFTVRGMPSTGDKVVRAGPLSSQCEAGNVKLVAGPWVSDFLDELEVFGSEACAHDDQADAATLSFNRLVNRAARIHFEVV
jgi:predicted phage terminase large subunit-like protein